MVPGEEERLESMLASSTVRTKGEGREEREGTELNHLPSFLPSLPFFPQESPSSLVFKSALGSSLPQESY